MDYHFLDKCFWSRNSKMYAFVTSFQVKHHVHVGHSTLTLPSLRLSFRNGLGWDEDVGVVRHGQTLQVFSNKNVRKNNWKNKAWLTCLISKIIMLAQIAQGCTKTYQWNSLKHTNPSPTRLRQYLTELWVVLLMYPFVNSSGEGCLRVLNLDCIA